MNNMKVATLTSSLLARKGTAVPSAFAPTAMPPVPPAPTPSAPTPPAAAARKTPRAANIGGAVARPKRDGTGRIKMSLRLKPDLHLKLKLVAAFRRESAQKLLVAAIERYLDQIVPYGSDDMGRHVGVSWRRGPSISRRIAHDLAPDLDQLLQRHRQRPLLDLLRHG